MEKLIPRIKKIAERISETESKRKELSGFIKEAGPQARLFSRSEPDRLDSLRIAAIDGGLGKKPLHGFDCILVRAVGVCFQYTGGKLAGVEYWPSKMPSPVPEIFESLSDMDWAYFASLMRIRAEIDAAIETVKHFKPDILLLDGSIVPHYADRPSSDSAVYKSYLEVLERYKTLYMICMDNGITLAGIIEDSRNTVFCDLLRKDILPSISHNIPADMLPLLERTRDTNLLYFTLEKGEKTLLFRYCPKPSEHPVLKDLGEYGKGIKSFYLKTAEHDRPIKVDTLSDDVEKLASVLMSISGHHSGYGIPAPIIEADNVAKIPENEMENFYTRILSIVGNTPSAMKLRREQRPFK